MKKIVSLALGATLAGWTAGAQNLNSTVEVTNDYMTAFSELDKHDIPMSVPDSLLQYDRTFQYRTFEKPYEGSYEFVPYSVRFKPEEGYYGNHRLWLKAGAGYTVHPVLDFYYEPRIEKSHGLDISIYQKGSGYWGEYRDGLGTGYDFAENLGFSGRVTGRNAVVTMGLAYDGYYNGLASGRELYNGADAFVGVKSFPGQVRHAYYDFTVRYRYGSFRPSDMLHTHDVSLTGSAGPLLGKVFSIPIDFSARYNSLSNSYLAWIAPHFKIKLGPVDLNAGAKVGVYNDLLSGKAKFGVYPDVQMKIDICKRYLTFYAVAAGGPRYYGRSEMLERNHFDVTGEGMQNCEMDFFGGFRGAAGSIFQYDLSGGYGFYSLLPFESVAAGLPGTEFLGANLAHADARLMFHSDDVDAEIGLHYKQAFRRGAAVTGYEHALLTGSARLLYNYHRRVFAGVYLEGATKRSSCMAGYGDIPGFVNLGVYAEYKFTSRFSLWAEGANLADMAIYRSPLYAEKGVNFTVGICFSL